MAVNEKSIANLKPIPFGKDNPPPGLGRPKGSRNRKSLYQEWLALETETEVNGVKCTLPLEDQIVLSMIQEAKNGNVAAFTALMDGVHGKIPNQTINVPDKKTFDVSIYSDEQLRMMQDIIANPANPMVRNVDIPEAEVIPETETPRE